MQTETETIQVKRSFKASPEQVFDAWLDPEQAAKFLFATSTGQMVRAEVDPKVGGRFCFTDRRDGEDVDHVGEYIKIDRPRQLVFTFGVPKYSPARTTVTIDIAPTDTGCDLTLTHEGVLPEYAQETPKGWNMILDGLERTVA